MTKFLVEHPFELKKTSMKISIIWEKDQNQIKICMRNDFDALLNYVLNSTKVGT